MRIWVQCLEWKVLLRVSATCLLMWCPCGSTACAQTIAELPDAPSRSAAGGGQTSSAAASITGTVQDTEGALIGEAKVQVIGATGEVLQEVTSGSDGQFQLQHIPPGPVTVRVTLQGFDPLSTLVTLSPGEVYTAKPFSLKISTMKTEVDVKGPAQASAEDEIHVEETQRLFGFLPNFYVTYDWHSPSLSAGQKYRMAAKDMLDPGNLLLVGTVAGVQQGTNSFPGYRQGLKGYGKRYGADYANLEVGTLLGEAVLPALLHQDPRYFYKGTGSVRSRMLYAISFAVIRRGDNGRRQFAYAGVLGDLSAGAVSNIYYPASSRHGAELTFENGLLGIAGDALNGLFQEFFGRKVTPNAVNIRPSTP